MQGIIEQHQKELNTLQKQFQSLLDMKDKELKDLSFKLKTTNGSLSTEVEQELRAQLQTLEQDMKSKSLEMRWLESDSEQNEVSSFIYLNYT
jgi:succinate dehydrogenase flavin-adding protein (antitoxin of CptAB toxin-antitoxin module)